MDQLGRGNEGNNNLVFTKVNHRQHQFLYRQFSAIKIRKNHSQFQASSEFSVLLLLFSNVNVKYC